MRFWSGRLFPFRIVVACCVCIVWTVDPSSKPVLHSKKCNASSRWELAISFFIPPTLGYTVHPAAPMLGYTRLRLPQFRGKDSAKSFICVCFLCGTCDGQTTDVRRPRTYELDCLKFLKNLDKSSEICIIQILTHILQLRRQTSS
jgi:hypothetical protein